VLLSLVFILRCNKRKPHISTNESFQPIVLVQKPSFRLFNLLLTRKITPSAPQRNMCYNQ
jgi:hypothetical protein